MNSYKEYEKTEQKQQEENSIQTIYFQLKFTKETKTEHRGYAKIYFPLLEREKNSDVFFSCC